MRTIRWVSFTWDLPGSELPPVTVPRHYDVAIVGQEEIEQVRNVITKSLVLDPAWNAALYEVSSAITNSIARSIGAGSTACLALRHGTRIIGGTLLRVDPQAAEHLVPGPCVLVEYRNRGMGTLLLQASLHHLLSAGLSRACAITSGSSLAARFLYAKFGGRCSPFAPLLAA